jgi:exopolysaccharide biosynthesis protein
MGQKKMFLQEGLNVEFDALVLEIINKKKMENCTVKKVYMWHNISLFSSGKDYAQEFDDYNYFVEIKMDLIEESLIEGISWPFERLYMDHKEILERKWEKMILNGSFWNTSKEAQDLGKFTIQISDGKNISLRWIRSKILMKSWLS